MKRKKSILLVILLMAVGFAAVSTTLYINGQTKINANQDDFNVYYSDALVNGVQDLSVVTDDTHITFTTTLETLGEKYVLDYDVTNGSKNYDAELVMKCTQGNDYLTVTNDFDDSINLETLKTRRGKLTLELIKSYAGDEDLEVTITCTIAANAIERDSLGEEENVYVSSFKYYAFGIPTTSSSTDYTAIGKNVFVGLGDENSLGVCIDDDGLFCIKNNDYDNTVVLLKEHFGEDGCEITSSNIACKSSLFICSADSSGSVYCYVNADGRNCTVDSGNSVGCN